MNLDHLETFVAVARRLNYTKAGAELHLSQSAVWRQMRQLETQLGVPLFEQIGKHLHLTDAGRTLEREAQALLGHAGRVEEAIRAHGTEALGQLRIGASTTPGFYLIPRVLGAFHAAHGDVALHFQIDNSAAIEEKILHNELDLAFVGGHFDHPDLVTREWTQDEIVCFAAPDHPLADRIPLTTEDLHGELCVLREVGSATRARFEEWMARRGNELERTMVVRCPEALKRIVEAGVGFSFLSIHGIAREVERRELVALEVEGMELRRPITVVWHRDKHLARTMQALLSQIGLWNAPHPGGVSPDVSGVTRR